jgi:anti-sigma factor (TIGR02949 family)
MGTLGCDDAFRHLWDLLDGSLEAADRDAVERHLAYCLRCCGELEFARELRTLLRTKGHGQLPADVRRRFEGFIEELGDPSDEGASL